MCIVCDEETEKMGKVIFMCSKSWLPSFMIGYEKAKNTMSSLQCSYCGMIKFFESEE